MFQCVLDETQEIFGSGSSVVKVAQEREDEDLMDRILREGLRLKKKVKTLNKRLAESETARGELQEQLNRRNSELESFASVLNATHVVEMQQLRDLKTQEIEDLKKQLSNARFESQNLPSKVASLAQTCALQQEEMNKIRLEAQKELNQLKESHQNELQQLQLKRDDYGSEVQRSQLLRRALIAEAEVERLAQSLSSTLTTSKETQEAGIECESCKDLQAALHNLEESKRERERLEIALNEAEHRLEQSALDREKDVVKMKEYEEHIESLSGISQEQRDVLQAAQREICILQEAMDELVRSKESVEAAVTRVSFLCIDFPSS